mgnify:CR=1 FL=1
MIDAGGEWLAGTQGKVIMVSEEQLAQAVGEALSITFEGMAFVELMQDTEEAGKLRSAYKWVWGAVNLQEPYQGRLCVIYPEATARHIVSAVYGGAEEEIYAKRIADALGELTNTAAGVLLSRLVAEGGIFSLGLPQTGSGWPDTAGMTLYVFQTDSEEKLVAGVRLAG